MTEIRVPNVAVRWTAYASAIAFIVLFVVAWVAVPPDQVILRAILLVVAIVVVMWGALQPLLWWWGAELRVDDRGLFFGSDRVRSRPAQITFAARNPYLAGWDSVSNLRIVRGRAGVRGMRKRATLGAGAQPTTMLAYFPAAGHDCLVFDVDLSRVSVPAVRPASRRRRVGAVGGSDMEVVAVWAFPLSRTGAVLDVLRARGVAPVETSEAQMPVATIRPMQADDPYVIETLTQNLGRPPTPAELDEIRRQWPGS